MGLLRRLIVFFCGAAAVFGTLLQPASIAAEAAEQSVIVNWVRIGGSVIGELYADRDSLLPYTKDGNLYLGLMVQEKFTSPEFLKIMRNNSGLEKLSSSLTLYMFQVREQRYFIASQFYLDNDEQVCLDLGADKSLRPVGSNASVKLIFEYALQEARRDSIRQQQ